MSARRFRANKSKQLTEWEIIAGEEEYANLRAKGWTTRVDTYGCSFLSDETIGSGESVRMVMLAGRKLLFFKGHVVLSSCLGDGEFAITVDFDDISERNQNLLEHFTGRNN
ncbi:MAG: hypothetical protein C0609_11480 [Deltaproteobacteria bacterium]|nr:MAG: hypothetical protein C0609_11480 [Deltaproteobacteria bacterium]